MGNRNTLFASHPVRDEMLVEKNGAHKPRIPLGMQLQSAISVASLTGCRRAGLVSKVSTNIATLRVGTMLAF